MSALKNHAEIRRYVTSIVRRIVKNESDVEDVVQDALLTAHRHRESFRGESQYSTWLYRIAVRAGFSYIRRSKRPAENASENAAFLDRAIAPGDSRGEIETREALQIARDAVDALGDKCKNAYYRSLDGSSESEIARALGITRAAAKARLHRARCAAQAALAAAYAAV